MKIFFGGSLGCKKKKRISNNSFFDCGVTNDFDDHFGVDIIFSIYLII